MMIKLPVEKIAKYVFEDGPYFAWRPVVAWDNETDKCYLVWGKYVYAWYAHIGGGWSYEIIKEEKDHGLDSFPQQPQH